MKPPIFQTNFLPSRWSTTRNMIIAKHENIFPEILSTGKGIKNTLGSKVVVKLHLIANISVIAFC